MIGIYKITSPNNRVYIGQSMNIENRLNQYRLLKCKRQPRLYNSLKKYGFSNHIVEVVTECSVSELNNLERYYQELYGAVGDSALNCCLVDTSVDKKIMSNESRKKLSESCKKRIITEETRNKMKIGSAKRVLTPELRKKFATQTGRKLSEKALKAIDWTGRKHTEESKEKIRQGKIGKKLSPATIEKTRIKNIGKKRTYEQRQKISLALKGRVLTDKAKYLMGLSKPNRKPVLDLETGIFYDSIGLAAGAKHIDKKTLQKKLRGTLNNNTSFILI